MGKHLYNYNWDFFEKDSEELYYFLGFIAADGYISDNEIELTLNEKDIKILEKLRDLIVPDKPLIYRKNTKSYMLKISCKKRIPEFKKFYSMTTNNKHKEIKFPLIKKQYIKHFIRGYIDGDGSIGTAKAYRDDKIYIGIRLRILGNLNFLKELNNQTKNFVKHKTNSIRKKGTENVYEITYNFSTANALLEWLYKDSNIYLERKYIKAEKIWKDEDIV